MAKKKRASRSTKKVVTKKTTIELHRIAHYTFFVGLLVAIVAGLFRSLIGPEVLVTTLVILGFIVGLFNLTAKETMPFLVASIALMLAGIVNLGLIPGVGLYLRSILSNIVVFVVPGAIIMGLKTIWKLASD
ncbi:hypothetical protein HOL21_02930 [Candidatus Woesearchaeota archaeon]|jgi:hypothetical protein|nr:hypothetical protein [Candidatus Woesearchaeota archaeon]MBT5397141.1 hypothetical protein [Candidatus Woesearchaeota archaeon]MBT5924479.1 hypothetical protein [Candidatus Woesearchaeota archaeon]MBT6367313.1 hypothetical protein [Candidatus Woesearchaeota archaeon]MBT7762541.1 hypothetical protein [Candidatus Woesearchaeota archaeon]